MSVMYDAVDLFAGPGGWDVSAATLGLSVLGVEWDKGACDTRRAAGLPTLQCDVSELDAFYTPGMIASPPCQTFSTAGKGSGRAQLADITAAIRSGDRIDFADPRTALVLEPLRWARAVRPLWIALEQVPAVLPIWEAIGEQLIEMGYSVSVGKLSAEQYGVPQTRKRAVLVASRLGQVTLPIATHRAYRKGVNQAEGDQSLLPWVSMADALGWGFDGEPAATISAGGTKTGSAEPFANANYRKRLADVTYRNGTMRNAAVRPIDTPAPTILFGHNKNNVSWHMNAAGAANYTVDPRPAGEAPAATITGKGTAAWVHDAPSTTVQGDPRIAPRGHHDRQFNGETVRVSVQEAAILQSFPADYPWQGSKTKQYEQVGNAIPPLLALPVLQSALRLTQQKEAAA